MTHVKFAFHVTSVPRAESAALATKTGTTMAAMHARSAMVARTAKDATSVRNAWDLANMKVFSRS